jgi:DNA polymerase
MDSRANRVKLQRLYRLKALGFEYVDPIKQIAPQTNHTLPSNFDTLRDVVMNCHLCELSKSRKNVVFGEGNIESNIMFVGEGPGMMEDESGRPFVGRAGAVLTKMIENVLSLKREDVYIANIVKCRPPNNRVPTIDEANSCKEYLFKQIDIIKPKIIVALGSTSYKYLTNDNTAISKIRGIELDFNNSKLIATFHPSYLLRNPSAKKIAMQDLLKIKDLLDSL